MRELTRMRATMTREGRRRRARARFSFGLRGGLLIFPAFVRVFPSGKKDIVDSEGIGLFRVDDDQ
jgi:hypothetical protein